MKCHAGCPLHFEAFIPEDEDLYSHKTHKKIIGHSSFLQNNQELGELQEPSLGERLNKV